MSNDFVHLHDHFDIGSLLDGHMRPIEGLKAAKALGMTALGMTDHGFCHGHYQFWKDANSLDMKPILGCEVYVAPSGPDGEPSDRTLQRPIKWRKTARLAKDAAAELEGGKDVAGGGKYTHQTIIARTPEGLRGLWRATSEATRTGIYGKQSNPRVDHNLLREHAVGLIATTGCPSGEVATRLRLGQIALARAAVARDLEIYGRENYFLEVMDHGLAIERDIRDGLIDLMRHFNLRPLATNDAHYATPANAKGHDALICVQTGASLADPTRFKFDGDSYSIRPAAEMYALFDGTPFAEACRNTLVVAEMVESYDPVFAKTNRMPVFPVPDGTDSFEFLWQLVRQGLAERYCGAELAAAQERAEYEMSMIRVEGKHDFTDYLLVLWDLCAFMRSRGILFGPRGSAGGSVVLYALRVAAVDPIKLGLAFERFINPERVSPPDVDVDVDDRRRPEVEAYLAAKYGEDHVAANITFGYIGGKAAIKDSARILDQPVSAGAALSKAYPPPLFGKSMWLADRHNPDHERNSQGSLWAEFEELITTHASAREIVAVAEQIEQRVRNTSEHACAAIVSNEPLWGVVPLEYVKKTGRKHVCFEYAHIEEMGLQKLDLLGLRNWRIVAAALDWVFRNHGVQIDLDDVSFDDPAVYQLLAKGQTLGVFQLESGGMQKLLKAMKPTSYDDIMAVLALYRPGPMGEGSHEAYARRKNGQERVAPIHPELAEALEPILGLTHGLIVFQEQVMAAVQTVAGFSLGRADLLRKAMGKKNKAYMDGERVEYERGAAAKGFSVEAADALWRTIEPFADYAFNKCVSGETDIVRLGRGSHPGSQKVRDIANRLHGRGDYDGTGCRYCYNEAGRPVSPRSRECKACKAWRAKWRMHGGMNAAGRVGDRVLPVRVTDVFRQGVKPLYKMTLANGMSLTTTANHRHLTPAGWRRLDELAAGDHVSVMSDLLPPRGTPRTDTPTPDSNWIAEHGYHVGMRNHGKAGPMLHGRHSALRRITAVLDRVCAHCGAAEGDAVKLDRAHLDSNPLNNVPENLALLCGSCHRKHDYATGSRVKMWRKGREIESSEIVSIEYVGEEMTYDVTVDSEDHSWVANGGIITHNSHTASYGRLSYWSAWLKAHYPTEFMAATLDAEAGNKDQLSIYLAECRRMGIPVTVPDINESAAEFTPTPDGRIRFGLAGIRSVGDGAAAAVLSGRESGPYRDFVDFLERAGVMACTKVAIEGLAEAGAFDQIEPDRRTIFLAAAKAAGAAAAAKKRQLKTGQVDLFTAAAFGDAEVTDRINLTGLTIDRDVEPFERREQLDRERERLGLYLSGHPLDTAQATLAAARTDSTAELLVREPKEWDKAILSGMIMNVDIKHRKADGAPFAAVMLEDLDGAVEVMFFAKVYELVKEALVVGNVVSVQISMLVKEVGGGEDLVDDGSDPDAAARVPEFEVTYMARDIRRLELIDPDQPVQVFLRTDRTTREILAQLERACQLNPGEQAFQFAAVDATWKPVKWDFPAVRVDMGPRFQSEVKALVGRSAFVLTPETAARRSHH